MSLSRLGDMSGPALLALLLGLGLIASCGAAAGRAPQYDRHQVFRVLPLSNSQISTLSALESGGAVDVWAKSREPGAPWDIMVNPAEVAEFRKILGENKLKWEVLIADVGRTLKKQEDPAANSSLAATSRLASGSGPRSGSGSGSNGRPRYLRHREVNEYLDSLAKRYPKLVSVRTIGKSSENRDLKMIKISSGTSRAGKDRPGVWIDAGIHAREWIAPATALYIIRQLVENRTHTANLTKDIDWYILPVVNPDGYEYSHTTDRLWRKTRSKSRWGLCAGADANRNFDYHWREVGASWSSCRDTYAGSRAFSEPEARAVRDFLLANKKNMKMYLTYHSYGNYLLYPWGFTSTLPNDWRTLDSLAKAANKAMVAAGSESYSVGSSTNVLYAAAGGSDDWAKGVAGIQLSYTIELPGGNGYGFDLPASYIPEVGRHQMEAIKVFAKHVRSA